LCPRIATIRQLLILTIAHPQLILNHMVEHPQSAELDRVFSALADPTRRAILQALTERSSTITEIARPFPVSFNAISKHVMVLERAGLVHREIKGREHYCWIDPEPLADANLWLEHYRRFWRMPLDWTHGDLFEGLRCFHSGAFFEAHEHWESVWLAAQEPEKTFLQGLIQVAASFHHFQRGNCAGTISLLRSALRRLDRYPEVFAGIGVAPLRRAIRSWLQALETIPQSAPPPLPAITLTV